MDDTMKNLWDLRLILYRLLFVLVNVHHHDARRTTDCEWHCRCSLCDFGGAANATGAWGRGWLHGYDSYCGCDVWRTCCSQYRQVANCHGRWYYHHHHPIAYPFFAWNENVSWEEVWKHHRCRCGVCCWCWRLALYGYVLVVLTLFSFGLIWICNSTRRWDVFDFVWLWSNCWRIWWCWCFGWRIWWHRCLVWIQWNF